MIIHTSFMCSNKAWEKRHCFDSHMCMVCVALTCYQSCSQVMFIHVGASSIIHEVQVEIPHKGPIILVRLQQDGDTWLAMRHLHEALDIIIKPNACPWSTFHNLVIAKGDHQASLVSTPCIVHFIYEMLSS